MVYNKKECGMSEECLIALEQHFLELQQDDCDYWRQVIEYEVDTQNWVGKDICWWQALSDVIDNAFGPSKQERYNPAYLDYERRVNKGDLGTEIFGVDLLLLPINAQAATYYEVFDAQAIVAKFEHVEISSIQAEKMTCIICLDDFDKAEDYEAEDNKSNHDEAEYDSFDNNHWVPYIPLDPIDDVVEEDEVDDGESDDDESDDDDSDDEDFQSRHLPRRHLKGKLPFDNTSIKLSCPHGHLIGKSCLVQFIDADFWKCPMCRVEIYAPPANPDPRGKHPGIPTAVDADQVTEQYAVWD
jgi:hypothetical protein